MVYSFREFSEASAADLGGPPAFRVLISAIAPALYFSGHASARPPERCLSAYQGEGGEGRDFAGIFTPDRNGLEKI